MENKLIVSIIVEEAGFKIDAVVGDSVYFEVKDHTFCRLKLKNQILSLSSKIFLDISIPNNNPVEWLKETMKAHRVHRIRTQLPDEYDENTKG